MAHALHTYHTNLQTMERPHFDTLAWHSELACHIQIIDKHRRKLIEIFNLMIDRYNARTCRDNITEPFFKLAFAAESYFFDLEIMLRQLNYPGFSKRKEANQLVLNRIVKFKEDFAQQKETVCIDMLLFLNEWMRAEVIRFDEQISSFLKTRGVA